MIGLDPEPMFSGYLCEHGLQRVVADFPLPATLSTDEMVVRLKFGDFIIVLVTASVRSYDET